MRLVKVFVGFTWINFIFSQPLFVTTAENEKKIIIKINDDTSFTVSDGTVLSLSKISSINAYKYIYRVNEFNDIEELHNEFIIHQLSDNEFLEALCLGVDLRNYRKIRKNNASGSIGKVAFIWGIADFAFAGVSHLILMNEVMFYRLDWGAALMFYLLRPTALFAGVGFTAVSFPLLLKDRLSYDKNHKKTKKRYNRKVRREFAARREWLKNNKCEYPYTGFPFSAQ